MQRIDLTLPLTNEIFALTESMASTRKNVSKADLFGHIGTHLDLMGKAYPDEYFTLCGQVFDVRTVSGRDIEASDIDLDRVGENDFVFFHSGCLAVFGYASREYMSSAVQLSWDLIGRLLEKKVAMIGVDFAGVRRQAEHPKADILCADAGTFVVENVVALERLAAEAGSGAFTVHCYPMRLADATGLPCRIIAEV
ncbi:MAG: cyclase family protein [Pseudodesulfovibrio sp.]